MKKLLFLTLISMFISCKKEDIKTGYIIVTSRDSINVTIPSQNPTYTLTIKNTGEASAYNISVEVDAIKNGVVIDKVYIHPNCTVDPGQSITTSGVFLNLSKYVAPTCSYEDCGNITWNNLK